MEPWRLVGQRLGPAGYLAVQTQTFVTPDDDHADWDILIGGRTVAVVAITDDDRVVLARQFRPRSRSSPTGAAGRDGREG